MKTFFDSTCGQSFHYFLRDEDDHLIPFHADDSECQVAEHSLKQIEDGELERIVECPQCGKRPADHNHIRACIGYKTPYSESEIRDAYSDSTEYAKREALLQQAMSDTRHLDNPAASFCEDQ